MQHPTQHSPQRANAAQRIIGNALNLPNKAVSDSSWAFAQVSAMQAIQLLQKYSSGISETRALLNKQGLYTASAEVMVNFVNGHIHNAFGVIEQQIALIANRTHNVENPDERSELMNVVTIIYQVIETFVLEVQNTCFSLGDLVNSAPPNTDTPNTTHTSFPSPSI